MTTGGGIPIHVTPYGRGWAIRRADDAEPIGVHEHLTEAQEQARHLAQQQAAKLIIFNQHWQIDRCIEFDPAD